MSDISWFEPFSLHQQVKRVLEVGCSSMLEDDKPADEGMARAEAQLVARPSRSGQDRDATNRGSQPVCPADAGESSRSLWWLNSARRSSLLNLLSTRPGSPDTNPTPPSAGQTSSTTSQQLHPQRTSASSGASDARPEPAQMSSITPPPDLNQGFACRAPRGGMSDIMVRTFLPHHQAKRTLGVGCSVYLRTLNLLMTGWLALRRSW